jgi:hypothetical protein
MWVPGLGRWMPERGESESRVRLVSWIALKSQTPSRLRLCSGANAMRRCFLKLPPTQNATLASLDTSSDVPTWCARQLLKGT